MKKQRPDFNISLAPWKSKLLSIKVAPLIQQAIDQMKTFDESPSSFSAYGKDVRNDRDKAYDLIEGWFFEDLLMALLEQKLSHLGYSVKAMGCDQERVIKINDAQIDSEPDIGIFNDKNELVQSIELKTAHKLFSKFHIKSNNLEALHKHPNTLLFFWLLESNELAVLSINDFTNRPLVPNPAWGGKECYQFSKEELQSKVRGKINALDFVSIFSIFKSQGIGNQVGEVDLQKL